jgi:hypothetical protein
MGNMGAESIFIEEANKKIRGHFQIEYNGDTTDDDGSVRSGMLLLPEVLPHHAAGILEDASDGVSYLTDPTSSNCEFTLTQMFSRMPPFPPLQPQQAVGITKEEHVYKSASDILVEVEEQDFGQAINEDNEYISKMIPTPT